MEFPVGTLVWVEAGEGYLLPGKVKIKGKCNDVIIEANGKEHSITLTKLTQSVKKRDVIPESGTGEEEGRSKVDTEGVKEVGRGMVVSGLN